MIKGLRFQNMHRLLLEIFKNGTCRPKWAMQLWNVEDFQNSYTFEKRVLDDKGILYMWILRKEGCIYFIKVQWCRGNFGNETTWKWK